MNEACINWKGAVDRMLGYGVITIGHRDHLRAHRWAWQRFFGPIPKGGIIHHSCENKLCINPMHLELSNRAMHASHHSRKSGPCPNGHMEFGVTVDGWRRCLKCHRDKERARNRRKKLSI